jgi:probable HAF family extracellular repeat protein
MTTGKLLTTAGVLLAFVSLSFRPAAAQMYTVTDLGTLGGKTCAALAINSLDQVVGTSEIASGANRAFLWSDTGGMINLGTLYSSDGISDALGVNDSGWVVGDSGSSAFLWTSASGMTDIGNLGGVGTIAFGINNSGQVVGTSNRGDGTAHAFLWSMSTGMQDLGTLGGSQSTAYGINDSGEVVGMSYLSNNVVQHAFIWTATGGMQDLGTLGSAPIVATAINSSGQVVGSSGTTVRNKQAAFLWADGFGMHQLGLASDGSVGGAINDSSQVVGSSLGHSAAYRGFLWTRAGGYQSLTSLCVQKSPYVSAANGINSSGVIAATGSNNHALLLTPTK